jgi:hypothetical protein
MKGTSVPNQIRIGENKIRTFGYGNPIDPFSYASTTRPRVSFPTATTEVGDGD